MADEWISITQARNISGLSKGALLKLGHEARIEMTKGTEKSWHKFNRTSLIRYLNEQQNDTKLQVIEVLQRVQEIVTGARSAFETEGLHDEYQALTSLLAVLAEK